MLHESRFGLTPLDMAIQNRLFDLAALFVSEYGLDPFKKQPGMLSSMELLVRSGFGNADHLMSGYYDQAKVKAVYKTFLDHPSASDVNTRSIDGGLLILAVKAKNLVLCHELLDR